MAVCEESPGTEGKAAVVHRSCLTRLGVWVQKSGLLALLIFVGDFSVACLNAFFLHGKRPVHLNKEGIDNLEHLTYHKIKSRATMEPTLTLCSLK